LKRGSEQRRDGLAPRSQAIRQPNGLSILIRDLRGRNLHLGRVFRICVFHWLNCVAAPQPSRENARTISQQEYKGARCIPLPFTALNRVRPIRSLASVDWAPCRISPSALDTYRLGFSTASCFLWSWINRAVRQPRSGRPVGRRGLSRLTNRAGKLAAVAMPTRVTTLSLGAGRRRCRTIALPCALATSSRRAVHQTRHDLHFMVRKERRNLVPNTRRRR
jgi:hypothetical protein